MTAGRGFGIYEKGSQIDSVDHLHVGDLLLEYSPRFDAENTVIITREFKERVWACFVDPTDWTQRRGSEFCIWDFDLEFGQSQLWRAVPKREQ